MHTGALRISHLAKVNRNTQKQFTCNGNTRTYALHHKKLFPSGEVQQKRHTETPGLQTLEKEAPAGPRQNDGKIAVL